MVSHSLYNNSKPAQITKPVPDLWSNLVEVHRTSFKRSIQRKREREEDDWLCSKLNSLTLVRRKDVSLETSFKKLCLQDEGYEVDGRDHAKTTSQRKPCTVSPGVDQPSQGSLKDAATSDAVNSCVVGDSLVEDCTLNGKEDGSQSLCQRQSSLGHPV